MANPIEQFSQDAKERKNVVFCAKCGSTYVDQYSVNSIQCSICGNASIWDADRFSIAREGDVSDVRDAFTRRNLGDTHDDGGWHQPLVSSLMPLMHGISGMGERIGLGATPQISRQNFNELTKLWDEAKVSVDAILKTLEEGGISEI